MAGVSFVTTPGRYGDGDTIMICSKISQDKKSKKKISHSFFDSEARWKALCTHRDLPRAMRPKLVVILSSRTIFRRIFSL